MKRVFHLLFLTLLTSASFLFSATRARAALDFNLEEADSYNAMTGGAQANARLGRYNIGYANFDNDGKTDLILTEYSSPHDIYIILGSQIDGSIGQVIDPAQSGEFFLRYTPANANEYNQYYTSYGADLDGNGSDELIIGNDNATEGGITNRGAVYIIYDSLIQAHTGMGTTLPLSNSSNWNLKLMGESMQDHFGTSFYAKSDLDLDQLPDLVAVSLLADYSDTDAGAAYVITAAFLNTYSSTTGNYLSMADPSNYSYRVDGPVADFGLLSFTFAPTYDYDNDQKDDLVIMAPSTGFTEADAGSYYFISNTILDDYAGTGNVLDLSDTNDFNLRIDSPEAGASLGYSLVSMGDVNNNGKTDLVLTAAYASNAPRSLDGTIFLVYDEVFDGFTGTGNIMSLLDTDNYTVKYVGKEDEAALSESTWLGDYNNDGKLDLITHDWGSTYVLENALLANYTGTGHLVELGTGSTYSYKFYKNAAIIITSYTAADFDGDGSKDFILSEFNGTFLGRANAESLFIVLNFPHTLSLNSAQHVFAGNSATVRGSVTSPSSVTNVAGVQYLIDAQNPDNPNWAGCTASDGSFNSTTEAFVCNISGMSYGAHTIYIRAYDEKGTYTPATRYVNVSTTVFNPSDLTAALNTAMPQGCNVAKPNSAPELFQINTSINSATLHFVPSGNNVDSYFIRYGTAPDRLEYGDYFMQADHSGVIVRKINHLRSNTPYYFQVRAGNGCMPGEWGNTLKATTTSVSTRIKQFYLYLLKPKASL